MYAQPIIIVHTPVDYTCIHQFNVGNFTTNLAECWMNIHAKLDGGKQYKRSQRGAWEGRCAGAGLWYNNGPEWGTLTWKKITGKDTNPVFKTVVKSNAQQVEKTKKRKATDEVKKRRRDTKYRETKFNNSLQAHSEYAQHDSGPEVHDVHLDVPADILHGTMSD